MSDQAVALLGSDRRTGMDRRHRREYRFFDRRHGFHRRKRHPVLGTLRDNPWLLVAMLVVLNLLSIADGALTLFEIGLGIAVEGNPILAAALEQGTLLAAAVKLGAIAVVTIGIWHGRRRRQILLVALAAVAIYGTLGAYHMGTLAGLGLI